MASGPNKVVANARRRMGGFPPRPPRPQSPMMQWFFAEVKAGRRFESMEQAEAEFEAKEKAKCA